jgi:hypothetical protein
LVRSEADRDLRSCWPRSVTDEAMLCLLPLRFGGVAGGLAGNSYGSSCRGGVLRPAVGCAGCAGCAGGRLSVGGAVEVAVAVVCESEDGVCLCPLFLPPPKMEGRRVKMLPPVFVVEWSAMVLGLPQ